MADSDTTMLHDASRRRFLRSAGAAAGGAWLAGMLPALCSAAEAAAAAHSAGSAFMHLAIAEAAGLEAIAARIIPSDGTPGAREAGVIHFIDQSLGTFMADAAPELRAGLASLEALAGEAHGERVFAELDAAAQDALLARIEDTAFFGLVHFLTIGGMFALPAYGGNRDHLGWQLLGLSRQHAWSPPFGHYDAAHAGRAGEDPPAREAHDHG